MPITIQDLFNALTFAVALGGLIVGVGGWLAYGSGNQSHEGLMGILVVTVGYILILLAILALNQVVHIFET